MPRLSKSATLKHADMNHHGTLYHIRINADLPAKKMDELCKAIVREFNKMMPGHGVIATSGQVEISRIS